VSDDDEGEVASAAGRRPDPVPYDRFRQAVTERREALRQVGTLTSERDAARTELAAAQARLAEMETRTRRVEARAETGIDDDHDLDVVLRSYEKANEGQKKKPALKEWLGVLAADEKAAAEHLPASLRAAYLGKFRPQEERGGRRGAAPAPAPAPRPPVTATAKGDAPAIDLTDRAQAAALWHSFGRR
jgi:hypothetical protein